MLGRRSAAAAAATARLASRPQLLRAGSCSARGRTCANAAAVASANRAAQRMRAVMPGTHYYLARARSAPVKNNRPEYLQQPLSTLVEPRGEGSGRREPPEFTRPEGGRWGWTGVVGGEDDQDCGEERKQEARGRVGVALATLASPQRMMAERRYRNPSSYGNGGARGGGDQGGHLPAGGGPKNTSGGKSVVTATNAIIAINVAAFMMQNQDPSFTTSYFNLAFCITDHGEWYRLVTSTALHGGVAHLLCNCMSLGSIGPTVENILGTKRFVALYACAGVAGNVLSCIVNPLIPSLGASGAIFGLLGAEAILLMRVSLTSFLASIMRTAFFAMLVALLVPNIDHMGHLGGFLGGAFIALLLRPRQARLT